MLKGSEKALGLQAKIGGILSIIPLHPNHWTLLSVVVAVAGSASIILGDLPVGLAFFCFSALLDAVDGAVARFRGQTSKLGAFMDGVSDRVVEALFLISLMFYPLPSILLPSGIWLASLLFLGTCMTSYVRAYAHHKGIIDEKKAGEPIGPLERGERIGLIVAGILAGILLTMDLFIYSLILAVILSFATSMNRFITYARMDT